MKITTSKIATRIAVCLVFMFSSIAIQAVEKCTIIWSVLGDASLFPPRIIEKGNSIGELPNPTIEYDGKVFYGWTEIPNYDNPTEPPTIINERTIPQTSTTYYAVFAKEGTSGSGTAGWSTVTSTNDLEAGAIYAISNSANGGTYLSTYLFREQYQHLD